MIRRSRSLIIATVLLALAGCAPQTEVVKLYENEDRPARQYERLLVVSIVSDTGSRRRLEELITQNLAGSNVTAFRNL